MDFTSQFHDLRLHSPNFIPITPSRTSKKLPFRTGSTGDAFLRSSMHLATTRPPSSASSYLSDESIASSIESTEDLTPTILSSSCPLPNNRLHDAYSSISSSPLFRSVYRSPQPRDISSLIFHNYVHSSFSSSPNSPMISPNESQLDSLPPSPHVPLNFSSNSPSPLTTSTCHSPSYSLHHIHFLKYTAIFHH